METSTDEICKPLPASITNSVTTCANSDQYIINFLEKVLPACDRGGITDKLKTSFTFSKLSLRKVKKDHKKKEKYLSVRKRAQLGLNKIGFLDNLKYSEFLPLNKLWLEYIEQLFGDKIFTSFPKDCTHPGWGKISQQLIKADFHGAKITISKSLCPSLVGKTGIIIQDSKNVFRICERNGTVKTIPKNIIEFLLHLPCDITLKILGKQLAVRPAERTGKKNKVPRSFEL